jgi:triacylglycerol lipase
MPGAGPDVFLVPGFFGFANLGDVRYFGHVRAFLGEALARLGVAARVHVVRTYPTASLPRRAGRLAATLARTARGAGPVHLIGHSSGGLDARLLLTPGVRLAPGRRRGAIDVEEVAARVEAVVTVSTPHHGTPVASFLTGMLGQRILRLLSLSTIYVLRFGRLPLSVVLKLGAVFALLDRQVGLRTALLDQLFSQLLSDFTPARRRAIERFFHDVGDDQALLTQLTLEGMDVFNATAPDRPGVRYGSVVTRARRPGLGTALAAGLDPSAQATHAIYAALYQVAARGRRGFLPAPAPAQAAALRSAWGAVPGPKANDGLVPTLSQPWGEVIHAADADHHDVLGHFADASRRPPHFDWLASGSRFDRAGFEAAWTAVARFVAARSARAFRPRRQSVL